MSTSDSGHSEAISGAVHRDAADAIQSLMPAKAAVVQPQLNWPLFRQHLLQNLHDGVIFVDPHGTIKAWNRELEAMTGMSSGKVLEQAYTPVMLQLRDQNGEPIGKANSPLAECLRTGVASSGEFRISGRSGREVKVEINFVPATCAKGLIHGAIMLIHDYSIELDLQRQLKDLYEFSTLDPLTQVSNRSEFERVLDEYVRAHQTTNFCCSLIVCDIDFFKQINDNYNHHIGDLALVAFASLLKKFVRAKDIVARYGGEEFVILCANCDGEAAVQRAEEIRLTLTQTPQPMLDGKCITASFGVSQLTSADSATDLFVRADTALLTAKEQGRNRVVCEMGIANSDPTAVGEDQIISEAGLVWKKPHGHVLASEEFRTHTPLPLMVPKLRGYIVEKDADLRRVEPDSAQLQVEFEDRHNYGRRGSFLVDVEFQVRQQRSSLESTRRTEKSTYIRITIREAKRKWFSANSIELAPELMREVRDFLMIGTDESLVSVETATDPNVVR